MHSQRERSIIAIPRVQTTTSSTTFGHACRSAFEATLVWAWANYVFPIVHFLEMYIIQKDISNPWVGV